MRSKSIYFLPLMLICLLVMVSCSATRKSGSRKKCDCPKWSYIEKEEFFFNWNEAAIFSV